MQSSLGGPFLEVDQEFTEFTHLGSASHQVGERLKSNLISGEPLDTLSLIFIQNLNI